jgi:sensor domain CHASE-containing protein
MTRFRLFQNLRTALMLLVAAVVIALGVALWWANKTGLPEEWREAIENEISRRGVHVEIDAAKHIQRAKRLVQAADGDDRRFVAVSGQCWPTG